MKGLFYRIRYCDLNGREVPVYEAVLYRIFLRGQNVRDFSCLTAANKWIKTRSADGGAA